MTQTSASPRRSGIVRRPGDLAFSGGAVGSALRILIILAGVAIFLTVEAIPAFTAEQAEVTGGSGCLAYVWPLVAGTVIASIIAIVVATPIAVGIALFISHYAPRRIGSALGFVVDLLAAVPSVVFGMWGMQVFAVKLAPFYQWLEENLGFL